MNTQKYCVNCKKGIEVNQEILNSGDSQAIVNAMYCSQCSSKRNAAGLDKSNENEASMNFLKGMDPNNMNPDQLAKKMTEQITKNAHKNILFGMFGGFLTGIIEKIFSKFKANK